MKISIVLEALTANFESDMARATRSADKNLSEIKKAALRAGKAIGVALSGAALDRLIKNAGDFQDLSEKIGDSAQNIASLKTAADIGGQSMDDIAAASVKLTKGLAGIDDETKGAGRAIGALGLNVADFKALSPVEQFDSIAKALAGFEDGSGKTAVAVALLGKSGADALPFLKELGNEGERQILLTDEQIKAADDYADSQAKAISLLGQYASVAATQAAPALTALTLAAGDFLGELAGVNSETGKLGKNSGIADFANGAVRALGFVVDAGQGVVRVFQGVGLTIGAAVAQAVSVAKLDFSGAKAIGNALNADLAGLAQKELFSAKLSRRLQEQNSSPAASAKLPKLNFSSVSNSSGGARSKAVKQAETEAQRLIKNLSEQLALYGDLSESEKIRISLANNYYGKVTPAQAAELQSLAAQLDAKKADADAQSKLNALSQEALGIYDATRTPLEKLQAQIVHLNELRNTAGVDGNPILDPATYERAVAQAQDAFDKLQESAKDTADKTGEYFKAAAQGIQGALADFLFDPFKDGLDGLLQNVIKVIQRILVEFAAAKIGEQLFGANGDGKGGFLEGILGAAGAAIGSSGNSSSNAAADALVASVGGFADGGSPPLNRPSWVGERGPELIVPRGAMTVVPNHKLGGGSTTVQNFYISAPTGTVSRQSQAQIASNAARGLEQIRARRNA